MKRKDRIATQQKVDELKPKPKTVEEQNYVIRYDGIWVEPEEENNEEE
jgi:hypothetical protein